MQAREGHQDQPPDQSAEHEILPCRLAAEKSVAERNNCKRQGGKAHQVHFVVIGDTLQNQAVRQVQSKNHQPDKGHDHYREDHAQQEGEQSQANPR